MYALFWAGRKKKIPFSSTGEERVKGMEMKLTIQGMKCSHCSAAVERALSELEEVESAAVDLAAGTALVTGNELDAAKLAKAVEDLGYEVT
jgi:copper chaperone CopZ